MLKYILIFLFQDLHAQSVCALGFEKESNKINYNRSEVEKSIALENIDAVFYGETHSDNFEPEFKLHFIQHVNDRFGIRDVFMEISISAAYFFNEFLVTGDTTRLQQMRLIYNNRYNIDFWRGLYTYNSSLVSEKKLRIHGVDFERVEVFKLLDELKKDQQLIPIELKAVFDSIHQLATDKSLFAFHPQFEPSFNWVKKILKTNEAQLQVIYGNNYPIIQAALNNKAPVTTRVNPRNPKWFELMKTTINNVGIQKFVAFFGRSHTNDDNSNSMPQLFKQTIQPNRVCTIAGVYYNHQGKGKTAEEMIIQPYGYKEKDVYEENAQKDCRATIVAANQLKKSKPTTKADYYVFAKDFITARK
jgi:hypothetical protein